MSSRRKRYKPVTSRLDEATGRYIRDRTAAAKLGWKRRQNEPEAAVLREQISHDAKALKQRLARFRAQVRREERGKLEAERIALREEAAEAIRKLHRDWQENERAVIESYRILLEIPIKAIYEGLFGASPKVGNY